MEALLGMITGLSVPTQNSIGNLSSSELVGVLGMQPHSPSEELEPFKSTLNTDSVGERATIAGRRRSEVVGVRGGDA